MATQKLQPTRALQVIPSENASIPSVNLLVSSISTSQGTNSLIDTNANFIITTTNGVQYKVNVGDVVYNYTTGKAATIVQVVSNTTLLLNADNIVLSGEAYSIYQQGGQTGIGNQGCVLYIGTGGSIKVTTSGNDILTFVNVQDGTFFPINVLKVFATGTVATNIIALW
jgi:ethanolamine utilization protein EutQ (cupin superfamily)